MMYLFNTLIVDRSLDSKFGNYVAGLGLGGNAEIAAQLFSVGQLRQPIGCSQMQQDK